MPSRTFEVKLGDLNMDAAARLGTIRRETGFGDADILDALLLRGIDGTDPLALRKLFPGKDGRKLSWRLEECDSHDQGAFQVQPAGEIDGERLPVVWMKQVA